MILLARGSLDSGSQDKSNDVTKKPGVSASTSSPLPLEDNSAEDEKDADSKTLGTLRMHIKSKHQIYCIQPDLSTSSPFKTLEESSAEDEQDDICSNAVSRT